ncbi:VOC family protein [Amycolatopsis sp. GM8]|uniref:VOC family protein n=1 Tax=Amycolatopsis sp. GM8 TaxID=2896530 RepID=UPI001F36B4E8|nr:VOC family protein [Amycolatopsis sp. GM8]
METSGAPPRVSELGHVGIRCHDVERQLAFYTEVLGLTVTDRDDELGNYFLSARPKVEHHELLLARGRDVDAGARLIQQLSWRCDTFEDLVRFFRRFQHAGVELDMVVSHGNALGIYFFDPEGNRCEVYWQTGLEARQPFIEYIDLDGDPDQLIDSLRESVRRFGASGRVESGYVAWTKKQGSSPGGTEGISRE